MHHFSKLIISTAFNVLILNVQYKILSILSLKLHKFQNSQVSQKNYKKTKHILSSVTSLQNNIDTLGMVFCLHLE